MAVLAGERTLTAVIELKVSEGTVLGSIPEGWNVLLGDGVVESYGIPAVDDPKISGLLVETLNPTLWKDAAEPWDGVLVEGVDMGDESTVDTPTSTLDVSTTVKETAV